MLKPSLIQMLNVAKDLGLETIQEAFDNYTLHYTCFFYIPEYSQQMAELTEEIKSKGLVELRDGLLWMKCMKIEDALKQIGVS